MVMYPQTVEEKWALWLLILDTHGVGPGKIKSLYDSTTRGLLGILDLVENSKQNIDWLLNLRSALHSPDLSKYMAIIESTFKVGAKICTLDDPYYPRNLRLSKTAPPILFYRGSLDEISERSLALVGTVNPSNAGIKRAERFARLCVENNIQVISGLARGIDTVSHETALKLGGKTFAVIGHGIDYCYPPENKDLFERIVDNGAVISQFPTGTKPMPWMFPARNETMCTLSSGTVIIEAHAKCGSIIQAKHSFKHQRRVFLLNSNLELGDWAQKLIDQGAFRVDDFNIVLQEMSQIHGDFADERKEHQMTLDFSKLPKAVLFDLDGVLYDSNSVMEQVYGVVIKQVKGHLTERDSLVIREKINNAPTYVLKSVGIRDPKAKETYNKLYLNKIKSGVTFFPGIAELFVALKDLGFNLGIVTSQPFSRYKAIIEHASFKDLIDIAVTWNDIPRDKQKPDPAGITKALNVLEVKSSNAAYVGDDPKDIEAAKRAGVISVAAMWGVKNHELLLKCNPKYVAYEPKDVLKIEL